MEEEELNAEFLVAIIVLVTVVVTKVVDLEGLMHICFLTHFPLMRLNPLSQKHLRLQFRRSSRQASRSQRSSQALPQGFHTSFVGQTRSLMHALLGMQRPPLRTKPDLQKHPGLQGWFLHFFVVTSCLLHSSSHDLPQFLKTSFRPEQCSILSRKS